MKVAVIGAGVAGLVNARVQLGLGHDVVIYEGRTDLGGVWSATRGYPGLRTQNDKASYAFSDLPMADEVPEHPTRAHVQAYLSTYARHHGIEPSLRLAATVTAARWDAGSARWRLTVQRVDGSTEEEADRLIVANGLCSTPQQPRWPGTDRFHAAGGRVVVATDLTDDARFTGSRVVVVGVGKSGADVAVAAMADGAVSTDVVARSIGWKMPYRIGRTPFQRLVNTRVGEHLLWAPWRLGTGRLLRRVDRSVRSRFGAALERRVREQQRLDARGLAPRASIASFTHLATAGFFEGVEEGRIALRLGRTVERLDDQGGVPSAVLDDGTRLPVDLLVVATGFDQDVSFFDERTQERLRGDDGQVSLVRHTLPPRVPQLAFAGWTNSFRSPIASEVQALWIAADAHGLVSPVRRRGQDVHEFQLTHDRSARRRRPQFSAGASILDQDAWIREAGLRLPLATVFKELLRPLAPGDYAGLHRQLQERVLGRGATAERPPRTPADAPHTARLPHDGHATISLPPEPTLFPTGQEV